MITVKVKFIFTSIQIYLLTGLVQ